MDYMEFFADYGLISIYTLMLGFLIGIIIAICSGSYNLAIGSMFLIIILGFYLPFVYYCIKKMYNLYFRRK